MSVELRRSGDRGRTVTPWLDSRHSFSYGGYYDPDNIDFGPLLAVNEDRLAPGHGFDRHRHAEVEIVTWVLAGRLRHDDDAGHRQVLGPGWAQVLGAGAGVRHAEYAAPSDSDPVQTDVMTAAAHYVQMWVRPAAPDLAPVYAAHDFSAALAGGRWVPVASGSPDSAAPLRLRQLDAELRAVALAAGATVPLPGADRLHVHLLRGAVLLGEHRLRAGDAVRVTGEDLSVLATEPAELLVWMLFG